MNCLAQNISFIPLYVTALNELAWYITARNVTADVVATSLTKFLGSLINLLVHICLIPLRVTARTVTAQIVTAQMVTP